MARFEVYDNDMPDLKESSESIGTMYTDPTIIEANIVPSGSSLSSRTRRYQIVLIIAGVVVLIGLCIGISLGIENPSIEKQEYDPFPQQEEEEEHHQQEQLTAPPTNLSAICSNASRVTYQECKMICERAKCCQFSISDPKSCLLDDSLNCMAYSTACSFLLKSKDDDDGNQVLPLENAFTTNITIPTSEHIQQTQQPQKQQQQDHYFKANNTTMEKPNKSFIDNLCASSNNYFNNSNTTSTSDDQCHKICSPGKCCFAAKQQQTCHELDIDIDCFHYTSCASIYLNYSITQPTNNNISNNNTKQQQQQQQTIRSKIQSICSANGTTFEDDFVNEQQRMQCQDICQPGSCCFSSSSSFSNDCLTQTKSSNNKVNCHIYGPCAKLYIVHDDDTDYLVKSKTQKKVIDEACQQQQQQQQQNKSSLSSCAKACEKGTCCFEGLFNHCPKDIDCSDYMSCLILMKTTSSLSFSSKDLLEKDPNT